MNLHVESHFCPMDLIQPQHRLQVTFVSLEEAVEANNPVRFFDAFAEQSF